MIRVMARRQLTADELDQIANSLEEAARRVRVVSLTMRTEGLETVFVHGVEVQNRILPKLAQWAKKLAFDAEGEFAAHRR